MTGKKNVIIMLLAIVMAGIFAADAFAKEANYTCTVDQIGGLTANNGTMYVKLTDTAAKKAFNKMLFRIPDGRLNQIMAVLLTAASTGSTVYIRADIAIKDPSKRVLKFVYYNP